MFSTIFGSSRRSAAFHTICVTAWLVTASGCVGGGDEVVGGPAIEEVDATTDTDIVASCATGCNDGNPCTDDKCENGTCVNTPNTLACDDGNVCTSGDMCAAGSCSGAMKNCDDGNPCTTDSCDKDGVCLHPPGTGECDDGNPCTQIGTCKAGTCIAGPAVKCEDSNPCTTDVCDPAKGCTYPAAEGPCDDGTLCSAFDTCANGVCVPGKVKDCNDSSLCTLDSCDPATGACKNAPIVVPCSDGNLCTKDDACIDGACQGQPVACNDDNPCTNDGCDPAVGCTTAMNTAPCDDGNACTKNDVCVAGVCDGTKFKPLDCDDNSLCTTDSCDPKVGCLHVNKDGALCDDGNDCTDSDTCKDGQCQAGANTCQCVTDADCAIKEDGNLCNGTLYCDKTSFIPKCVLNAATIVTCAASGDVCSNVACNPLTGKCDATAVPDGTGCDADASVCTAADACKSGACQPGAVVDCDDKNPCTDDVCKPAVGCVHSANTAACDADGNACTAGDTCSNSTCVPGVAKKCDDGLACTQDSCNPQTGNCVFDGAAFDGDPCDADGSVCSVGDACKSGSCVKGTALKCDDGNPCTQDACDAVLGCTQAANAASCDDGNACTAGDACSGGKCASGQIKACIDGDKCTTDGCNGATGQCTFAAIPGCSNQCTKNADCDDGKVCTDDTCSNGICKNSANTAACSDGDICTEGDACKDGACQFAKTKNCDDGNSCTDDSCDPKLGCASLANAKTCDADSDACTVGDACSNKVCIAGLPKNCDDYNPCTADACEVATGKCLNYGPPKDGTGCDADGSLCTVGDACKTGFCVKGTTLTCDDGNPCTADTCLPTKGCQFAATTGPCDDGLGCTVNDACANGKCASGAPRDCNDNEKCTTDSCDAATGKCVSIGIAGCGNFCAVATDCNDKNGCTDDTCKSNQCVFTANVKACADGDKCLLSGQCAAGKCVNGTSVNCDDGNSCTDDACDPKTGGCLFTGNAAPCNDGNACTLNDACKYGKCTAGAAKDCSDANVCTDDTCNTTTGVCGYANNTKFCDDANACTSGDVCVAGKCTAAIAGLFESDIGTGVAGFKNGTAKDAQFNFPQSIARDAAGAFLVTDLLNNRIRKVAADGTVTTFAGTGAPGLVNGPAATAQFSAPTALAFDRKGNLFVADYHNNAVRKIDTSGNVTTYAGTGTSGWKDGKATEALFAQPVGLAVDDAGVYVSEAGNHTVRMITHPDPTTDPPRISQVITLAGGGVAGYKEDVGKAARFNSPVGLATGPNGTIYVADSGNHRIRRVASNGYTVTIIGSSSGYKDGNAAEALFSFPVGLTFAPGGDLLIADRQNLRIRALGVDGLVRTIAGDGTTDQLNEPSGMVPTGQGRILIVDQKNSRLRVLKLAAMVCEDFNLCTSDACDPKTGGCAATTLKDGTACSISCLDNSVCQTGTCVEGSPKNCNDYNACTWDYCGAGVCKYAPAIGVVGCP
jgi:ribosomal protein S11